MKTRTIVLAVAVLSSLLAFSPRVDAAKGQVEIPLNARCTELLGKYTKELESLRAEVVAALPAVDEAKKTRFLEAREKWNGLANPSDDTPPAERKALDELREQTQAESLDAATALLGDLAPVLSSDTLDPKLMRIAILTHGTPRGLAEFAQGGAAKEKLLETLFADEALMRQVLEADGANGGEYGGMMEVYTAILAKSERAREVGSIFQRLALGTAIHMPWPDGKPEAGVHGIVHRTQYEVDQVERYLHYEKAYLDGELDAAFKDFNTLECRFITDSEYSN